MGGYFKTTKDFYKKLWAFLEMAESGNYSAKDLRMRAEETKVYSHNHFTIMLGFIRAWPDMPELKELKPLFDRAKEIANADDVIKFPWLLRALRELKDEMIKNGMGGR